MVGEAKGSQRGNAAMMEYRLRIPRDGGEIVVAMEDWLYLQEDGTLINRTSASFQECERTFIDMVDFNNYKQVDATSGSVMIKEEKLQFDLMRNVPAQIEKFFEIQHFDFDNSNAFLNSPDNTNLSSSDSSHTS